MTKIEQPIPDEIMEQARDVADRLFRRGQYRDWHVAKDPERIIALALQAVDTAAEKRGEERERERCARVAEAKFDLRHQTQARFAAMNIAAAIRSGS